MSTFIKGDRVKRTGPGIWGVKRGDELTVTGQIGNALYLEGYTTSFSAHKFDLVIGATRTFSGGPANVQNLPKAEGAYNPHNAGAPLPGYAPNIGHTKDGGGLQQHSVGGPYPFVVVGIDNPTGLKPGLYWFVQDKTGRRVTAHRRSCDHTGNVAANLSQLYPDGICPDPTPDLSHSDGYIPPLPAMVTIELTREAAEVLQLMCAHTAGPLPGHILPVISEALGYGYDETKARHDVSFWGYGPEYTSGWHKGRNTQGALAVTPKGAV